VTKQEDVSQKVFLPPETASLKDHSKLIKRTETGGEASPAYLRLRGPQSLSVATFPCFKAGDTQHPSSKLLWKSYFEFF
jgi:hypothetical protein